MCGRFTQSHAWEAAAEIFDLDEIPAGLSPRYNVAPTQPAAVVRADGGVRSLALLRWGLIPSGAPDPSVGSRLINARAESAHRLPSFRAAFAARRCLVPVDGFYEWERRGRLRLPWLFRMDTGAPFALAGLHERWRPPPGRSGEPPADDRPIETFAILTTEANAVVRRVHDRMPVVVAARHFGRWLSGGDIPLGPCAPEGMVARRVSSRVNSAANDDPRCAEPLPEGPPGLFGRPPPG